MVFFCLYSFETKKTNMHEFKAAKELIDELKDKQPKKAVISLGKMISSKDVFLEIIKEHTKQTPLEKTEITIEEIPVRAKCSCGFVGVIDIPGHVHFVRCPKCGKIAEVLEGDKVILKDCVY